MYLPNELLFTDKNPNLLSDVILYIESVPDDETHREHHRHRTPH